MAKLKEAMAKITVDMCKNMEYGEEIELIEGFTLYHYTEEDIIVLNRVEDWTEIYQILIDGDKIIFEDLGNTP
jgi:hypothetical protein